MSGNDTGGRASAQTLQDEANQFQLSEIKGVRTDYVCSAYNMEQTSKSNRNGTLSYKKGEFGIIEGRVVIPMDFRFYWNLITSTNTLWEDMGDDHIIDKAS
jgi:hypothetical protein